MDWRKSRLEVWFGADLFGRRFLRRALGLRIESIVDFARTIRSFLVQVDSLGIGRVDIGKCILPVDFWLGFFHGVLRARCFRRCQVSQRYIRFGLHLALAISSTQLDPQPIVHVARPCSALSLESHQVFILAPLFHDAFLCRQRFEIAFDHPSADAVHNRVEAFASFNCVVQSVDGHPASMICNALLAPVVCSHLVPSSHLGHAHDT